MKHTGTEGTWDARIKKTIWGVPIALVIIGILILLFAYLQSSYIATVIEVGETSYTPARKMVRGTSSSYYRVMLEVEYTNHGGEIETASVQFGSTNPNTIPKAGDQIPISRGLRGMVTHPNRNLIGASGGAAGIGGLFILIYLLTMHFYR